MLLYAYAITPGIYLCRQSVNLARRQFFVLSDEAVEGTFDLISRGNRAIFSILLARLTRRKASVGLFFDASCQPDLWEKNPDLPSLFQVKPVMPPMTTSWPVSQACWRRHAMLPPGPSIRS